jgi:hypothetical protein
MQPDARTARVTGGGFPAAPAASGAGAADVLQPSHVAALLTPQSRAPRFESAHDGDAWASAATLPRRSLRHQDEDEGEAASPAPALAPAPNAVPEAGPEHVTRGRSRLSAKSSAGHQPFVEGVAAIPSEASAAAAEAAHIVWDEATVQYRFTASASATATDEGGNSGNSGSGGSTPKQRLVLPITDTTRELAQQWLDEEEDEEGEGDGLWSGSSEDHPSVDASASLHNYDLQASMSSPLSMQSVPFSTIADEGVGLPAPRKRRKRGSWKKRIGPLPRRRQRMTAASASASASQTPTTAANAGQRYAFALSGAASPHLGAHSTTASDEMDADAAADAFIGRKPFVTPLKLVEDASDRNYDLQASMPSPLSSERGVARSAAAARNAPGTLRHVHITVPYSQSPMASRREVRDGPAASAGSKRRREYRYEDEREDEEAQAENEGEEGYEGQDGNREGDYPRIITIEFKASPRRNGDSGRAGSSSAIGGSAASAQPLSVRRSIVREALNRGFYSESPGSSSYVGDEMSLPAAISPRQIPSSAYPRDFDTEDKFVAAALCRLAAALLSHDDE